MNGLPAVCSDIFRNIADLVSSLQSVQVGSGGPQVFDHGTGFSSSQTSIDNPLANRFDDGMIAWVIFFALMIFLSFSARTPRQSIKERAQARNDEDGDRRPDGGVF